MMKLRLLMCLLILMPPCDAGLRAWAKREARLIARHGVGHYQQTPPGVRFVGVGMQGKTCMSSGRHKLHVRFRGYNVKIWK